MITDADFALWLRRASADERRILVEAEYHDGAGLKTLYLADGPFVSQSYDTPANTPYLPRLRGSMSIKRSCVELLYGGRKLDYGDIEIDNGDRKLLPLIDAGFDGRALRIYVGSPSWPRENFRLMFAGFSAGITIRDPSSMSIQARDASYILDQQLQKNRIPSGINIGKPIPIALGECYNCEAVALNEATPSYYIGHGQVNALPNVYASGQAINGSVTGLSLAAGTFALTGAPSGMVTFDTQGQFVSGAYTARAGDLISYVLRTYAGWSAGAIDAASIALINLLCPQAIGVYVADDTTPRDVIEFICRSLGLVYGLTRTGTFFVRAWRAPNPFLYTAPNYQSKYVSLPQSAGNYVSSPTLTGVQPTGGFAIVARVARRDWAGAEGAVFGRAASAATGLSWALTASPAGLRLYISTNGTSHALNQASGAVPGAAIDAELTIAAEYDPAGFARFYTSPDNGATWAQFASFAVTAALVPNTNSAAIEIGAFWGGTSGANVARVRWAQLRTGNVYGAPAVAFSADDFAAASGSCVSATGHVWTLNTAAPIAASVITESLAAVIRASDVADGGVEIDQLIPPLSAVTIGYKRRHLVQKDGVVAAVTAARRAELADEYSAAISTDATVKTKFLNATDAPLFGTAIIAQADAQLEAARRLALRNRVRRVYSLNCFSLPLAVEIGSQVRIEIPAESLQADGIVVGIEETIGRTASKLKVWV